LSPTIPLELHVSPWFIIIPVVIVLVFFAQSRYRQERKTKNGSISPLGQGWPWWLSGIVLGIIGVISYPAADAGGQTTPLALTGGYVGILAALVYWDAQYVGWEQAIAVGAILGAAIAAHAAREWKIRVPSVRVLGQTFLGGLIMGVGAVLGDGCNITTILIGVPLFSLGGILAGASMVLGCWSASYLMLR
jgi:hypothetical protein